MSVVTKTAAVLLTVAATTSLSLSSALANPLPDVPVPFKNGTGVIKDGVIYIGLGSAGKSWYKLDLGQETKTWEKIAEFTGTPRDQATSAVLNGEIYVFGGIGKDSEITEFSTVLSDVYRYSPQKNSWEKLPTRSPKGLAGHTTVTFDGKQAVIFGGVNKAIFDGYFADLSQTGNDETKKQQVIQGYFGKPASDYFFNREILEYDPVTNEWHFLGMTPFPGTAGAAAAISEQQVILVNGELKPGLRTPTIQKGTFKGKEFEWAKSEILPSPQKDRTPEGLAGAFIGFSKTTLLVAGGANFPGAQDQYKAGKYWAHNGLTKTWNKEIYGFKGGVWNVLGELPIPLGYGVSIQDKDILYLIGGETENGQAVSTVHMITAKDGKTTTE